MPIRSLAPRHARRAFDGRDDRQLDQHRAVAAGHGVAKRAAGRRRQRAAEKDLATRGRLLCRLHCGRCGSLMAGRLGLVTAGRAGGGGKGIAVGQISDPPCDCKCVVRAMDILEVRMPRILILLSIGFLILILVAPLHLHSQAAQEETLSGPDSHETGQGPHGHLFGDWGGERSHLLERGVRFDFQYISDSLWNIKSEQKERFASWNRFRGTVDIDFGALVEEPGLYFHATALWQAGGNLGAYLGLLTSPSGMSSANTFRLDSWWLEKRWLNERVTARVGQFAGQDFYGAQHYAASFIFEPMGYALGNLFNTFESFDPPSTPAMEVRGVPIHNLYVKTMVEAEDRDPFAHNPTGFVPQFRGVPVSVSEIGFTPGKKASSTRAFDNVESRKGYSGLYRFGASYNPGKFTTPTSTKPE